MTFAAPAWWWLLAAVLPAILALHVRRRRDVGVSSLRLWRDAGAISGPRARLRMAPPKPSWALALQLLAAVLLVGVMARPTARSADSDHLILVVDASARMTAVDASPDRISVAAAWAAAEAERTGRAAHVSVVRAIGDGDIVAVRASHGLAAIRVGDLAAGSVEADWNGVARRIGALLVPGEATRIRAVVAVGAEAAAANALAELGSTDVIVEPLVTVGRSGANRALAGVRLDAGEDGPIVHGRVLAVGEAEGPVGLTVGFRPRGSETVLPWHEVAVSPRNATPVELEIPVAFPGPGLVRVALERDAYPIDDEAWLAYQPSPPPFRVLRLGPADPALERALGAIDDLEAFGADELPVDTASFDLVVVTGGEVDRTPGTSTLWWNHAPPDATTRSGPVPLGTRQALSPEGTLVAGAPGHPLSVGVDALSTEILAWSGVERLDGADVLLADGLDRPLVQARTTRAGREVVVAFDPSTSSWPSQSTFPAFVAALVEWARFPGSVVMCEAGRPCRLPRDAAGGGGVVVDASGRLVAGEVGSVASGEVGTWPEGALERRFVPQAPGRYEWRGAADAVPIVVTAVPIVTMLGSEDEAAGIDVSTAAAMSALATDPARAIWWAVLLIVLIAEIARAGVGEERFLRAEAVGRAGLGRRRSVRTWTGIALVAATLAAAWWSAPLPWLDRSPSAVPVVTVPEGEADRAELARFLDGLGVGSHDLVVTLAPTGLSERASLTGDEPLSAGGAVDADLGFDLAGALADRYGTRRIVVRSDAPFTRGRDASLTATRGATSPLRIDATLVPTALAPLRVDGIDVPERVRAGERFEVGVRVATDEPRSALVTVSGDGEAMSERRVDLTAGVTRVPTTVSVDEPGTVRWSVDVVADTTRAAAETTTVVRPAPNVRIVTRQAGAGHTFAGLLDVQGVTSDVVVPVDMPWTVEQWEGVDAAVLLNVPALELHSQQQTVLQTWVRDRGGGAMILGGENTFGPGGYVRTPLDEISPLSSEVQREAPEVAMVFVLDRSGSMQQRVGGVSRLEIAKEATSAALDLLGDRSFAGIVAFDEVATTVLPMTPVTERTTIEVGLERLQANGGTAIEPALVEAYRVIGGSESATRHVVLFTDGLSQPGDFGTILARFRNDEITLSTVGIGQGTDASQLSQLARDGGGTFHQTNDFRALPGILAQEALLLSGSPVEEGRVQPVWAEPGQPFDTVALVPPPPLDGYVATTAKREATIHLVVDEQTPLLGSWTYGLGRVLAFASHGAGRWSEPWLESRETPALWADALGWVAKQSGDGPVVRSERIGDEVVVRLETVDAETPASAWTLISSDGELVDAEPGRPFEPIAPRTFEARWPIDAPGEIRLVVRGPEGFRSERRHVATGWASQRGWDAEALADAWAGPVALSGGRWTVAPGEGAELDLQTGAAWRWAGRPAPTAWLALAVALWLATLANRYLATFRDRGRRSTT